MDVQVRKLPFLSRLTQNCNAVAFFVVYLSAYGRMDLRGLFLSVPRKDYSRFQIYSAETLNHDMRQERERDGNNNTFMTMIAGNTINYCIVLLNDFLLYKLNIFLFRRRAPLNETDIVQAWFATIFFISLSNKFTLIMLHYYAAMDFETENTKIFEANYPENMRRVFVINGLHNFLILNDK